MHDCARHVRDFAQGGRDTLPSKQSSWSLDDLSEVMELEIADCVGAFFSLARRASRAATASTSPNLLNALAAA